MIIAKEQLSTFSDGSRDILTDTGDVVRVGKNDDFEILSEPERVTAISFGERAIILAKLAEIYAEYAEAVGMVEALGIPAERAKLRRQYGDRLEEVVRKKMSNAKAALALEGDIVSGLMKRTALIGAGFDADDIDTDKQIITIQLRHAIGVRVGHEARSKVLSGLYNPET